MLFCIISHVYVIYFVYICVSLSTIHFFDYLDSWLSSNYLPRSWWARFWIIKIRPYNSWSVLEVSSYLNNCIILLQILHQGNEWHRSITFRLLIPSHACTSPKNETIRVSEFLFACLDMTIHTVIFLFSVVGQTMSYLSLGIPREKWYITIVRSARTS